jgi:hypothetical protein
LEQNNRTQKKQHTERQIQTYFVTQKSQNTTTPNNFYFVLEAHGMEYIGIHYDDKLSGEATSQPHCRFPGYRQTRLKKLTSCVQRCREDPPTELDGGDLFVILNGKKEGI